MKNDVFKGSVFLVLGACSYGTLASIVKMAYRNGFTLAEVTLSQFSLGFAGLFILTLCYKRKSVKPQKTLGVKGVFKLMAAGAPLALTSIFFYLSVSYIPVRVSIVLLMQTVGISVVLEMILHKTFPGLRKILSVFIILAGTILATSIFEKSIMINWKGFSWGLMAALSYTATMYSSNHVELDFPPLKRSLYMILGGLIIIVIVFHSSLDQKFSYRIFHSWGLLLSLFGTIIPPLLFAKGMPLTGMGRGAIIASIEIPVSIIMANIFLKETVSPLQWTGVVMILLAVVLMNFATDKGRRLPIPLQEPV